MLDIFKGKHTEALPHIQQQPGVLTDVPPLLLREGHRGIEPAFAARILAECNFVGQRRIQQVEVKKHVAIMLRGAWLHSSQIAFAVFDGKYYLVDGQHRLNAIVAYGKPIPMVIALHHARTMAEVRSIYVRYDTVGRQRSKEQIINAFDIDAELGVSKVVARAVYSAIPYIRSGMLPPKQWPEALQIELSLQDKRLESVLAFRKEAQMFDTAIEPASSWLRAKLMTGGVTAVALMTFRYQSEMANEFWSGVAENDGLRIGDPRRTLIERFRSSVMKAGTADPMLVPCLAWNAFFERRKIKTIKILTGTVVKISGATGRR